MEGVAMLIFILLPIHFASSDQASKPNNPTECGGINITPPFYVAGQHHSCNLPYFQVLCHQNTLLLNLSADSYIITNISYTDQTLWVVNSAFPHSSFLCTDLSSLHNLTLDNTNLYFTSKPKEIVLLQYCLQVMSNYTTINCTSKPNTNTSYVGVHSEEYSKWRELYGECKWSVSVPYIALDAITMEDQLREGLSLKWLDSTKCPSLLTSGVSIGGIIATIIFFIFMYGCIKVCIYIPSTCVNRLKNIKQIIHGDRNVEEFIRGQETLSPKRYTYKEIKIMTMSFKEKLGEGGFSVVYKGKLFTGRLVAVKLLKKTKGSAQDFINEVGTISRTNHVNVVTLLGFFFEGRKRGLVYEFMPSGSLEKFTRVVTNNSNTQLLSWDTVFQIALGIARGLEYLHMGCNTRVLHLDIKPHNILLSENLCPKISDFGLAMLCPQTEEGRGSVSAARGTIGYIAPEVLHSHLGNVTHKSDVYSYGMMVLEVIGCRENVHPDASSSVYFPQWIYNEFRLDEQSSASEIMDDEERRLQRKMVLVSLWCIQSNPSIRPSMLKVVQLLGGSLESIQVPPIPNYSFPPIQQPDSSASFTLTNTSCSWSMTSGQHQELQEIQVISSTSPRKFGESNPIPIPRPIFSAPDIRKIGEELLDEAGRTRSASHTA